MVVPQTRAPSQEREDENANANDKRKNGYLNTVHVNSLLCGRIDENDARKE